LSYEGFEVDRQGDEFYITDWDGEVNRITMLAAIRVDDDGDTYGVPYYRIGDFKGKVLENVVKEYVNDFYNNC
jgi:hypothetical protein